MEGKCSMENEFERPKNSVSPTEKCTWSMDFLDFVQRNVERSSNVKKLILKNCSTNVLIFALF